VYGRCHSYITSFSALSIKSNPVIFKIDVAPSKLGFVVRTEKYFPAIPLGQKDGSFAFMLHEREGLKDAQIDYPNYAQTLMVFKTTDIKAAMKALKKVGVEFIHKSPQKYEDGVYVAFKGPFGNVSELIESRLTG